MKRRTLSAKLCALWSIASIAGLCGNAAEVEVLQRGPHHRVVKSGDRQWIELATGMNRVLADRSYVPANARFEEFQNGSLGRETQHQLITPKDAIDAGGTVDILWPTGVRFRARTAFLAYHSRKTGQSTTFAEVRSAQSQVAAGQTLWADCFEGATCDLLVTTRASGVECDVVFRAQIVAPEELGFAANDDSIMLQVWHELLDGAPPRVVRHTPVVESDPVKRASYAKPDISDEHLEWFGSFFIGEGRCFAIGNENDARLGSIPVYKTTGQTPDEKWWLIEETQYSEIAPLLATLPLADAGRKAEQMRYWARVKEREKGREGAESLTEGNKGSEERALASSKSEGTPQRHGLAEPTGSDPSTKSSLGFRDLPSPGVKVFLDHRGERICHRCHV